MRCECGGGGFFCAARFPTGDVMRCPDPVYEDEQDLLGVCPHLVPCGACGSKEARQRWLDERRKAGLIPRYRSYP